MLCTKGIKRILDDKNAADSVCHHTIEIKSFCFDSFLSFAFHLCNYIEHKSDVIILLLYKLLLEKKHTKFLKTTN